MNRLPTYWFIALSAWTLLLVTPGLYLPPPPKLTPDLHLGKVLHLSVYAVFAGSVGWLPGTSARRWRLIALLTFHAAVTEIIQCRVPNRSGSLFDVGLNHAGIILGLLAAGRFWPRRD